MTETSAFSPKFEEVGFETMNFLTNSGSFFVYLALGILEYVGRVILVFVCKKLARFRFFRRIGLWVDNPTPGATVIRLLMQTFIDLLICAILQVLDYSQNGF